MWHRAIVSVISLFHLKYLYRTIFIQYRSSSKVLNLEVYLIVSHDCQLDKGHIHDY